METPMKMPKMRLEFCVSAIKRALRNYTVREQEFLIGKWAETYNLSYDEMFSKIANAK